MNFVDFLMTLIVNIFNLAPIVVLCYLPFRKKLTKPIHTIVAQMGAVCVLFIIFSIIPGLFGFYAGGDLVATLFVVVGYFYFRKTVDDGHQKRNFIFCVGIYAGGTAHGIGHIFRVLEISERYTVIQSVLISIATYVIVYTLIGFLVQRFITESMKSVKSRDMDFLWVIPFMFSILTYFYIVSHNLVGFVDFVYPVVFIMLSVISFVVFIMLIRMLERMGNNAQLELDAAVANEKWRSLEAENAALDSLSRMKSEYMANLTHETKTPLTVISVHVQQAREIFEDIIKEVGDRGKKTDSETIIKSLNRAQEEIMRVSRISTNALWLASVQESMGQMEPLDISLLITKITEAYRSIIERRGDVLTIQVPEKLPKVLGNADQLVQVMANLLTNSRNHTENGEITVKAEKQSASDDESNESEVLSGSSRFVRISVKDSGTGIPPDLLPHVFERGITSSSDTGGTGMGLAISRSIIEAHNGDISIKSEHGSGTAVTFTLPVYYDGVGDETSAETSEVNSGDA